MKLTIALLLFFTFQVSAKPNAQKITIVKDNIHLSEVFKDIEQQTGYHFFYDKDVIQKTAPIDVAIKDATLVQALSTCLKGQQLTYTIVKNTIVIRTEKKTTYFQTQSTLTPIEATEPPPVEIHGRVMNQQGELLQNVSVLISGTKIGTTTSSDGRFTINSSYDKNIVLEISSVGYKTKTVNVGKQTEISVVLEREMTGMNEIVVTALGLKKSKGSLTYSTQSVDPVDMTQARSENIILGLSGKVAGINITTSANGVGSPAKVVLRGNRSINGSSQPLYVVDGLILNGDISNLSPDDIESISVLKGANAAALYGSRASNGAIIITTKTGSNSLMGVTSSIGFNYSQNSVLKLVKFQNEYGQGSNGIYSPSAINSWGPKMDGQMVKQWSNDPNYILNQLNGNDTYAFTPQPNNIWDFFRKGSVFDTRLSVNVKSEKSSFFMNYTNTNSQGIIRGNDLTGHNLSLHTTTDLTRKLKLESKVNYIRQNFSNILATSFSFQNPVYFLYQTGRNIRTIDLEHYEFINAEGKLLQHFYSPGFNGAGNPYWTVNNELSPRILERVLGMVSLKYNLADNVSVLVRSGLDRSNATNEMKLFNDTYITAPNGSYAKSTNTSYEWNTDFLLNYNQQIIKEVRINFNIGANNRVFKSNGLTSSGNNFLIPNLFALSNTTNPTTSDSYAQKNVNSVYALADVSFRNAVYLNVTGRNDWSSTLPVQNRSYFYPSIGVSVVLSNLVILPEVINYLKLNASSAKVGNDTDPYMLSRAASANHGAIDLSTILPNANLKPESISSFEAGLDLGLVHDRIRFSLTYYKENSRNQLFSALVPPASGVSSLFENGGDIENKGVEITLGVTPIRNSNFKWDVDINFSKNVNKVLRISEDLDEVTVGSANYMSIYKLVKGEPFGTQYTRGFVRDNNGNVIVDHLTGIPETTADMKTPAANFTPDWLGGINNSFRYKNFALSFLVDVRKGGSFVSFSESILSAAGVLDYTAKGRDGSLIFGENIFENFSTISDDGNKNTKSVSSQDLWTKLGGLGAPVGEAFVRSATNVRLREVILGYILPDKIFSSKKSFFKAARISLVGRNLFFFYNKAKNIDPEIMMDLSNRSEGQESLALPTTRSLGISLKIDF